MSRGVLGESGEKQLKIFLFSGGLKRHPAPPFFFSSFLARAKLFERCVALVVVAKGPTVVGGARRVERIFERAKRVTEREKVRARRSSSEGGVCAYARKGIEREKKGTGGKGGREIVTKQNDHDGRVQRDANTAHAFAAEYF